MTAAVDDVKRLERAAWRDDTMTAQRESTEPRFWRDDALAFIEARSIDDGRDVCYAKHAHETFSIGAITGGSCSYLTGRTRQRVGAGSVVLMNPGDVHACNPIDRGQWSYRMLYVDVPWLADIQDDLGVSCQHRFCPFLSTATTQRRLYDDLNRFYELLTDRDAESLQKHEAALTFMTTVQRALSPVPNLAPQTGRRTQRGIARAAEFIRENCRRSLKLHEICRAAELSASYLIRAFKHEYGMTPHAYLVNCRVEFSRAELRKGRPIAAVALDAGFADQAHLQRAFKKIVAATPGQYRAHQRVPSQPSLRNG